MCLPCCWPLGLNENCSLWVNDYGFSFFCNFIYLFLKKTSQRLSLLCSYSEVWSTLKSSLKDKRIIVQKFFKFSLFFCPIINISRSFRRPLMQWFKKTFVPNLTDFRIPLRTFGNLHTLKKVSFNLNFYFFLIYQKTAELSDTEVWAHPCSSGRLWILRGFCSCYGHSTCALRGEERGTKRNYPVGEKTVSSRICRHWNIYGAQRTAGRWKTGGWDPWKD